MHTHYDGFFERLARDLAADPPPWARQRIPASLYLWGPADPSTDERLVRATERVARATERLAAAAERLARRDG